MDDRQVLHDDIYERLISLENLFLCWQQFRVGKRKKADVLEFERHLEDNIFRLYQELTSQNYRNQAYTTFQIWDPKHRVISKSTVRDRLVHHVVFNELYRIFDPNFIYHSYASRKAKGTHLAVANLKIALRKESKNYTRNVFVLKCDIHKFFYSICHKKLLQLIQNKISGQRFLWLVHEIIKSFNAPVDKLTQRERERV